MTRFTRFIHAGSLLAAILSFAGAVFGQASQAPEVVGTYQVRVGLDRDDWTYEPGQKPSFSFSVTLNNRLVGGIPLKTTCGPEFITPPTVEKTITTSASAPVVLDAGTLSVPGFLRCVATFEKNGTTYRGLATAGFRPDLIKPLATEPKDFDDYWNAGKAALAKIPMDAKMELLPALSTSKADVYHVSFQNVGVGISRVSRIYGILAVPKTSDPKRRFPGLLRVPGAGVRPYTGQVALAERGILTLEIGIHGIPVTMPLGVYDDLRAGALNRYMLYNLDDRDEYYYRRVYLGCLRANDFLTSLPQFDGKNLAVIGGSQGGALTIMTAALDARVTALSASYPALADQNAYLSGRAGGWPHAFRDPANRTKEKLATASYYDTVNFAKRVRVPGIYSWGYNDEVVPPTSSFAAYNSIGAPKTLLLGLEMGHANTDEQTRRITDWIVAKLGI